MRVLCVRTLLRFKELPRLRLPRSVAMSEDKCSQNRPSSASCIHFPVLTLLPIDPVCESFHVQRQPINTHNRPPKTYL
jgi:hypothetical protein